MKGVRHAVYIHFASVLFGECCLVLFGEVSGDRAVLGPAGEIDTLKRGL